MSDLIVIPARYGSTRLPGKPLLPIAGQSLLSRVVSIAQQAVERLAGCTMVVATDDDRIMAHAAELGVAAVMTPSDLASGSDRARAAAQAMAQTPRYVVNLQGDAPFVSPDIVVAVMQALRSGACDVATPVHLLDWENLDRLRDHKLRAPFSGTTCIRGADGRALWFSKSILPAMREEAQLRQTSKLSHVWQHLGLYGYRMDALNWFAQTPPSPYEQLEGLEQLRFLEGGKVITTVAVDPPRYAVSGIDTAADVELAEQMIARYGDPLRR